MCGRPRSQRAGVPIPFLFSVRVAPSRSLGGGGPGWGEVDPGWVFGSTGASTVFVTSKPWAGPSRWVSWPTVSRPGRTLAHPGRRKVSDHPSRFPVVPSPSSGPLVLEPSPRSSSSLWGGTGYRGSDHWKWEGWQHPTSSRRTGGPTWGGWGSSDEGCLEVHGIPCIRSPRVSGINVPCTSCTRPRVLRGPKWPGPPPCSRLVCQSEGPEITPPPTPVK